MAAKAICTTQRLLIDVNVKVATVPITEHWRVCKDGDPRGLMLYEQHYSCHHYADGRERKLFCGPGGKLVLLTEEADALFVWRKFIDGAIVAGRDGKPYDNSGVNCAVFRNQSPHVASALVLEAERVAWCRWPGQRLYTYVDAEEVKSSVPGYCFHPSGLEVVRQHQGGTNGLRQVPRGQA